jgi:hypothetical protein
VHRQGLGELVVKHPLQHFEMWGLHVLIERLLDLPVFEKYVE